MSQLQEIIEQNKFTHRMFNSIVKTHYLLSTAVMVMTATLVVHTIMGILKIDSLRTTIDQQNIVQEAPIMTDLPYKKLGNFELTWYCPCEKCVGKKKIVRTATGTKPKANHTIAVDPHKIPLGSIVYIEGYGYFIAEDTGSAIKHNRIDIFVNNHQEALQMGKRHANVYLLK